MSLGDVQNDWRKQVYVPYRRDDRIPVMLVGLKMNLRVMESEGMVDPMDVAGWLTCFVVEMEWDLV